MRNTSEAEKEIQREISLLQNECSKFRVYGVLADKQKRSEFFKIKEHIELLRLKMVQVRLEQSQLPLQKADQKILRKSFGYDPEPPCCDSCIDFDRGVTVIRNSMPLTVTQDKCGKGRFTVKPSGCCDNWRSKNGEIIANPAEPPHA